MPSPGLSLNTAISGVHSGISRAVKTANLVAQQGVAAQETLAAQKDKEGDAAKIINTKTTNSVDLTA